MQHFEPKLMGIVANDCNQLSFPMTNKKTKKKAAQPLSSVSKFCYCAGVSIGTRASKCWGLTLAHLVTLRLWLWPGNEDYRSKLGGDCFADLACPEKCRCEGTTVDCSNQKLTKIPDHIPQYTTELWVTPCLSATKCIYVWDRRNLRASFSLFLTTSTLLCSQASEHQWIQCARGDGDLQKAASAEEDVSQTCL